jgi:hypothetical protein
MYTCFRVSESKISLCHRSKIAKKNGPGCDVWPDHPSVQINSSRPWFSIFLQKLIHKCFLLFYQLAFLWHFWNSCKWYVSSIKSMSSSTTICLFKKKSHGIIILHIWMPFKNEDFFFTFFVNIKFGISDTQ